MPLPRFFLPRIAPFVLILGLAACDERAPSAPPSGSIARELRMLGGDGQQAAVGAALPEDLVVTAVDAAGRPIPGMAIQFVVVAGGGQVAPQTVTADERGFARTRWTLGTVAVDSQVVEARLDGVAPLRLRARVRPDVPVSFAVSGGGAAGLVGAALADSLSVTVKDRYGNPVGGVEVGWEVVAGGGTVSPARSATRADGVAKAQWTLGPRVDSAQVTHVRVGTLDPVAFTANAVTTGVPLQLAKRGGDGQRGPAGSVLADSLGVVLRMQDGRPVVGALVSWSVPPEAGTVMPAVSRTDANGAASAVWRLGTAAGLVQATAAVDDGTLIFTALTGADAPAQVVAVGGGGEGAVGGPVADSLAVRVRDQYGNAVPGAEVAWDALEGGGTVQPVRSLTDAGGIARAQWVLGPRVDAPQAAQARVAGLTPVAFHASATTRGVPLQLVKRGGDGQRGPAGGVLADSLGVELRMQDGRPVVGALVRWSVPPEAGMVTPAVSSTDANGAASTIWRLGTGAGLVQATATVDDGTLTFTALTESGAPAEVAMVSGDGGTGAVGAALADSLAVRARDRYGNPVPGAEVMWEALEGGGSFQPARSVTDAAGIARAQWVLGPRVDAPQSAQARVAGLAPVAFSASATTRGVPLQLAKRGGDGQRGPAGGVLADSLAVVLRLPDGRPVTGAVVRWSVPAQAGAVGPAESRTDARGFASAAWRLGTSPGLAQATATVDEGSLIFTSLTEAAAPAAVAAAGGGGEGPVTVAMADSLAVRVTDAYGNPVPGAEVAWAAAARSGTVLPARSATDGQGIARAQWTLGPLAGPPGQAASATVSGLPPVAFHATGITRGVTLQLSHVAGNVQRAEVGRVLPESLTVQLRTQSGVRVQGATVTWSVISGGGQVSPATSRTDALGRARAAWTMGPTPRGVEATARVDDGVLTFYATAAAGAPAEIQVAAGNEQTGTRGTILPTPIQVRIVDAAGLPVSDAWVRWSVEAGGGDVESDSTRTNYEGKASTRWAVGMTPGDNAATATVNGRPPVRFTATGVPGAHYLRGGGEVHPNPYLDRAQLYQMDADLNAYVADAQGNRVVGAPITWTSIRAPLPSPRLGWGLGASWRFAMYGELPPIATAHFEGQQVQFHVPFEYYWSVNAVPPQGSGPYRASQPIRLRVYVALTFPEFEIGYSSESMISGVAIDLSDDNGWTARVTSSLDLVEWPVGSQTGQRTLTACVTMEYSSEPICYWHSFNVVP